MLHQVLNLHCLQITTGIKEWVFECTCIMFINEMSDYGTRWSFPITYENSCSSIKQLTLQMFMLSDFNVDDRIWQTYQYSVCNWFEKKYSLASIFIKTYIQNVL